MKKLVAKALCAGILFGSAVAVVLFALNRRGTWDYYVFAGSLFGMIFSVSMIASRLRPGPH
jgi:hypothetical protein